MADKLKTAKFNSDEGKAIFAALHRHYTLIAPVEKPGRGRFSDTSLVTYESVESFDEIEFFKKTYFSAKEIVFPVREAMFSLQDNQMKEENSQMRPTIIFLRSCDIHALKVLDTHFLRGAGGADIYYQSRREKIKVFLVECERTFENCFCVSLETNKTDSWSAFIRKKEDGYEIIIRG
jgi:anaerobic sulfite reductase subunit A